MEPEVGNSPSDSKSTVKEADGGSSSKRNDAFRSESLLDGKRHSLEYRNIDISCFAEVKCTTNVARKKRGQRAPPSSKYLHGKKVDKVAGSDDGTDNHDHGTEEGQASKNHSILHNEECIDKRAGEPDLPKTGHSETAVGSPSGYEKSFWREKLSDCRSEQDGANRTSEDIKDDLFDAQVNTTSSEDKSSEEVEDVKVCDICGDVGEEMKLAVCSRCNDGAEHIYCMRVMMKEAPEGEWLCEECQTEVEVVKEKKKMEKTQVKFGSTKGRNCEGKTNKPISASKSRSSSENEMDAGNVGDEGSNKVNKGNDLANSRKEDAGITPSVRQNLTEGIGLSMGDNSIKRVPLSRENSFRLDAEKGRRPPPQVSTSLTSNSTKNQAPPLCGQLMKSTSFNNSKVPKVKQLVHEVPQKPKNVKDPLSCIMKKDLPMQVAKSASFKKPKSYEASHKEESSIIPPAEESRITNPPVSRNVTNDRGTSILGCPNVTGSMTASIPLKADSRDHHPSTANDIVDSNNLSNAHGKGGTNYLGRGELKKPILAKTPGSLTLNNADRSSGILGSGAQKKVIQISDPSHRDEKIKGTSLRSGASSSSWTMRCQRCNEAGHSTQFCAVDKLRLAANKPMGERNLMDAAAKRNKTCEATSLVASEKADSRSADQSEYTLKYGPYNSAIYKPKDVPFKKPSQSCVRTEQDITSNFSTSSMASVDCSKLKCNGSQTSSTVNGRSFDNSSTLSLTEKSIQGFSLGDELVVSTVPELDSVWQGDFELWRTGRSPELCDGFQAHLSCSASSKVLEVAKKFPSKVQLEELPRQNSWPMQFRENCPTHDNIGLFFFARDTQSYENNYSKLVENMLKNDLVLRGNIETAELLIYPSNILSKNFQRWNMFYFLWGLFRVTRKDSANTPSDVPISKLQPNLNEDPLAIDTSSGRSFSQDQNSGAKSDHNLVTSSRCTDNKHLQIFKANNHGLLHGENSSNQNVDGRDIEDHHQDWFTASCSRYNNNSTNDFSNDLAGKHQELAYSEVHGRTWDSSGCNPCGSILDGNKAVVTCSISSVHEKGKESTTINLNNAENFMDVDHVNTTEVNSGATDPISFVGGSNKRNAEILACAVAINGTQDHKKIKLDNVGSANSSLGENIIDGRLSSKVHPLAFSSGDDCPEVAGSSKSNGKYVFPLDLNSVDDSVTGSIVDISSDEEDLPKQSAPDLELELGDNRSRKAMFSYLCPKVGEKQKK